MLKRRSHDWAATVALILALTLALVTMPATAAEPAASAKGHTDDKAAAEKAASEKTAVAKTPEKPVEKSAEKTAGKPGEKADSKPVEKSAEKTTEKTSGKPGEKPVVEKPSPEAKEGQNVDRLAAKLAKDAASANKAKKAATPAPVDNSVVEPEAQPPPLKVAALKDEMKRHAEAAEHPGPKGDRESLSKMAAEVNHAREMLREDTARMEALLASADPAAAPSEAEGGKKPPSPLDGVAKAMRGMKPEQAAQVVPHMERKLAADILRRMPAADAGKVMGFLKPELAAELAAEMAMRGPHAEKKR